MTNAITGEYPRSTKPLDAMIKQVSSAIGNQIQEGAETAMEQAFNKMQANLLTTQNAWQASIEENIELRAAKRELVIELAELKNICTKKQLAELYQKLNNQMKGE